ncbi:MAG: hypothetical protein JWO82_748 [Akkermansiaceae bacterium]|nr:hypothetical protein [Akkermansiaceae bacterium]
MTPRRLSAALFLLALPLHAGTPDATAPPAEPKKDEPWIKPLVDVRARYEFADVQGLDASHAFTTRERIGLVTADWYGFSALAEGEFTQAIVRDFTNGVPDADPITPHNTNISAPETNELNQAYLQFAALDSQVRFGRQRLIYDNMAFVGNNGWRQNEQTYDGISLSSHFIKDLTVNYAYIDRVNRIYGSEATGTNRSVTGDIHLINLSYAGIKGLTLGSYAYLMDFDKLTGWDNDTYGLSAKGSVAGFLLYGEAAFQTKAGAANDHDAWYYHAHATRKFGDQALIVGVEHLDAGFQTPLATLHGFNGFADVFNTARAGGTLPGLTDVYVSYTVPVFYGISWANIAHAMGDDDISTSLGWEFDSTLTKKFDDHFTAIVQASHFETESKFPTTTRVTAELNYKF